MYTHARAKIYAQTTLELKFTVIRFVYIGLLWTDDVTDVSSELGLLADICCSNLMSLTGQPRSYRDTKYGPFSMK